MLPEVPQDGANALHRDEHIEQAPLAIDASEPPIGDAAEASDGSTKQLQELPAAVSVCVLLPSQL